MHSKYLKLLVLFLFVGFNQTFAQSLKINWEDDYGREFSILAPSGDFTYSVLPGDRIEYEQYGDLAGEIRKVGNVYITHEMYGDLKGKITKVGSVRIEYQEYGELKGRVKKVGGLTVEYEEYGVSKGKIKKTTGQVRY